MSLNQAGDQVVAKDIIWVLTDQITLNCPDQNRTVYAQLKTEKKSLMVIKCPGITAQTTRRSWMEKEFYKFVPIKVSDTDGSKM